MFNEILPSLIFGSSLVLLGLWLIRWHLQSWRAQREDEHADDRERLHYRVQLRRRITVSVLLILLGFLLPLGDALMTARRLSTAVAALWIMGMLFLTMWIMLLAGLDWISSRMHRRNMLAALSGLDRKRRELEDEVARLRSQHRNGHG